MNHSVYRKAGSLLAAATLAVATGVGATMWHGDVVGQETEPAARSEAVDQANSLSLAFRKAAETATPTVVKIRSHTNAKPVVNRGGQRGNLPQGENPFKGTPFEDFFGENPNGENFRGQTPQRDGVGSGVIVDSSGIVLTNNHVVAGADEVTVHLPDGREFTATDIRTDPQSDLAVLRITADEELPAAKLGNSDELEIGDWVIAIGNPFELETTVSAGIISGKGRELSSIRRAKFLQTDAAINPGNSGGPLVNLRGEVIGINTAIASSSGGYQGIGFAIPANQAKWVMNQLVKSGTVQRGYLGIGIEPLTQDLADQFNAERGQGVVVSEVFPNSPAAEAGFEEGDVVTSFAGQEVHSPRDLQEVVERAELDAKQEVQVLRDGKPQTLGVVIKALPENFGTAARSAEPAERPSNTESYEAEELGLEVTELTNTVARQLGFGGYEGVVVTDVDGDGAAAEAGLATGMLIRRVGDQPVASIADFREAIEKASLEEGILLQVRGRGGNRFVVLQGK